MDKKLVWYCIGAGVVEPKTPLPELPEIPRDALVIIEGRAPIWRYGMAFHRLHGLASAVAVYDPRLGAVVVASHTTEYCEGDILDVAPLTDAQTMTLYGPESRYGRRLRWWEVLRMALEALLG